MADLGWQELMIILVGILIVFGAGKLPDVAKSLGQGVKEFRQASTASDQGASTRHEAAASAPLAPLANHISAEQRPSSLSRDAV